uniref:Potassium channel domain-containing protein n=1 Tax=Fibrocapsa japonica TaxID=94617 RepID=A0A7S2US81_9STRA
MGEKNLTLEANAKPAPGLWEIAADVKDVESSKKMKYIAVFGLVAYFAAGELVFSKTEGWDFTTTFYFMVSTVTTVGYGDFSPQSDQGKIAACLFILISMGLMGGLIGVLARNFFNQFVDKMQAGMEAEAKGESGIWWRWSIATAVLKSLVTIYAGGLLLHVIAHPTHGDFWSFWSNVNLLDQFYFAVVTCSTVGYGDITPDKNWVVEAYAAFWMLTCTVSLTSTVGMIFAVVVERKKIEEKQKVLKTRITTKEELNEMDYNKDGSIRVAEFVLWKVTKMGLVSPKELNRISQEFNQYNNGAKAISISTLTKNIENTGAEKEAIAVHS